MFKKTFPFLFTCVCFFSSLAQATPSYSNFYFFGDSLSDIGNCTVNNGCLTNRDDNTNECLTWANDLYDTTFSLYAKASSQGGTDYAVGGVTSTDLARQIGQYLSDHHNQVDPDAYYFFLIGSNDLINLANSTYMLTKSELASAHFLKAIGVLSSTMGNYNYNLENTMNDGGIITRETDAIKQ